MLKWSRKGPPLQGGGASNIALGGPCSAVPITHHRAGSREHKGLSLIVLGSGRKLVRKSGSAHPQLQLSQAEPVCLGTRALQDCQINKPL